MSTLPIPWLEAFIETALCIYGVVLLSHHSGRQVPEGQLQERPVIQQGADA
ncbi:MAG TPA: hypothetical protein VF635_07120 [Propionibacteriaceae bacterium]|jgi:hypothetical protein